MVGDPASALQELVARARALMQQGKWAPAEAMLTSGLKNHADAAELLRLLGTLYHLTARHGEAVAYLQQALERAPEDVRSRLNLGAALLADGRLADAEDALVSVLADQPSMEDAHLNLGLVLQRRGRMSDAAEQFQAVLDVNPQAHDARLSLSLCRLSTGEFASALTAVDSLLTAGVSVADATTVQVKSLLGLREIEHAHTVACAALTTHPEHAALRAAFGDVLVARGQLREAVTMYEMAIADGDDRLETAFSCAQCLMEAGQYSRASVLLEQRISPGPSRAEPNRIVRARCWQLLGDAYAAQGLHVQALGTYESMLPGPTAQHDAVVLVQVAQMQLALGRTDNAQHSLQRAAIADPGLAQPCVLAVEQSIAAGRLDVALGHCQRYTGAGHFAHDVVAAESFLLNALGQPHAAARLVDFQRLVTTQIVSAPAVYASLESFNSALAAALRAHPSLTTSGAVSKATQNGKQSGNLLSADGGVFAHFEKLLWSAANEYVAALAHDDAHPYLRLRPELTGVHCWGVVLKRAGYQAPHIHPTGWLSGVYYPEVPDSLGDEATHAGWLEFGAPPASLNTGVVLEGRRVKPREGLMVLFPSYFYHATVPFDADVERVSLAFDFTYALT